MSILFLDFDGVLNSLDFAKRTKVRGIDQLDPDAVARLKTIIERTGCKIVVSSSWRLGRSVGELTGILDRAGLDDLAWDAVIDKTPVFNAQDHVPAHVQKLMKRAGRTLERGLEIYKWREANPRFKDEQWCCVDDDSDFLPDQPLVRTTWAMGLQDEHAEEIIRRLT